MKSENNLITNKSNAENHFIYVPLCRQETEYTCGVACVQSILKCYGMEYTQEVLAEKLHTKPIYGTDFRYIISLMQQLGFQAYVASNRSIENIKEFINEGITPLLLIQAWADEGINYATDWSDGHYVIACGYDENRILFMDPYTLGNFTYIPNTELMKRWHIKDEVDGHYYNTMLIIKNDHNPFVYKPEEIKHME